MNLIAILKSSSVLNLKSNKLLLVHSLCSKMFRVYLSVAQILFCFFIIPSHEYDISQPLFLTPLIKDGRIEEAQNLAAVVPFLPNVVSYSGYITVDEEHRSHMFFWFFPKSENWTSAPLVVWLQGGPGASSLFALFTENGPYVVGDDGQLDYREYPWTDDFNVLYIDNPVGTGFSFTESEQGYCTDEIQVGENLHETVRQFLLLFPQIQNNSLILTGESYAGKYLPTLANTIRRKESSTQPKMKVFGVFMGNPLVDFEHMLTHYNEFLYAYGLLDSKGQEILRKREEEILALIHAKNWVEATPLLASTFFDGDTKHRPTLLSQLTGLHNHYNILEDKIHIPPYRDFLKNPNTTKALHVGNYTYEVNVARAQKGMQLDQLKSFKPDFEELLEHERVLVFAGQFDIICSYYLNEKLFQRLSWSGANSYYHNNRYQISSTKGLAGYYKQANNFTYVLIRDAGHMAITDQPEWLLGLLKKFAAGVFDEYIYSLDLSS